VEFLYNNKDCSKEKILQNIWERDDDSGKVLETIIYGLRQKLKSFSIRKNLILLKNNIYNLGE
jgi:DNA-binding response OmpR family regulator